MQMVYRTMTVVIRTGMVLASSIMVLGIVLSLMRGDFDQVVSFNDLISELLQLNSMAVVSLGILTLLLIPVSYVLLVLVAFILRKEYIPAVCGIFLLILIVAGTVLGVS